MEYTYKKIDETDKDKVFNLIDVVMKGLKSADFCVPFEQWEYDSMFDDKNYAPCFGAYDGDKLVGMMQLYVSQDFLADIKKELGLLKYKCCELGGALILSEYRSHGIAVNLGMMCYKAAQDLGFDYIVAAAHPENRSSYHTLERYADCVKEANVGGYVRKLYMKKLK